MPCIPLFCSNIYRGSKEAFALDPKALRWSLHLLVGPDCSRHFLFPHLLPASKSSCRVCCTVGLLLRVQCKGRQLSIFALHMQYTLLTAT